MLNRHNKKIPSDVLRQAREKIEAAEVLLEPYMLGLTISDKREMPKMGAKTLQFVEKSHEYANENPNLVPPFLKMEDFGVDFSDAHGLWTLHSKSKQLTDGIADIQLAAGSEALKASLVFYKSVKSASEQGIHGAKVIYDELKMRFPRGKKATENIEPAI